MSEKAPQLVYSTDSSGDTWERAVYFDTIIGEVYPEDKDICEAAVTLADELSTRYSRELSWLLAAESVTGAPSDRVREFIASKRMDQPRITVYSADAFESTLEATMAAYSHEDMAKHDAWVDWTSSAYNDLSDSEPPEKYYIPERELDEASQGTFIVNFQLPKPLDIFWDKQDDKGPISWGALYRHMADVPWSVVYEWEQKYGDDFAVQRLNPIGVHTNGDDGFYYLFEVSRRTGSKQ